jgi:hypothetical protein
VDSCQGRSEGKAWPGVGQGQLGQSGASESGAQECPFATLVAQHSGLLRRSCAKKRGAVETPMVSIAETTNQGSSDPATFLVQQQEKISCVGNTLNRRRVLRLGTQCRNGQAQSTWGHNLRVFPRSSFWVKTRSLPPVWADTSGGENVNPWSCDGPIGERVRSHHRTRSLGALNLPRRRWTYARVGRRARPVGTKWCTLVLGRNRRTSCPAKLQRLSHKNVE